MNLISKLSTYKVADGFAASGEEQEANDFADVQVLYVANAYLKMKNVQASLYDFSDIPVEEEKEPSLCSGWSKSYDSICSVFFITLPEMNLSATS